MPSDLLSETREERQRQIANRRRARKKDIRRAAPAQTSRILDQVEENRSVTRSELRELVSRDYQQPVASLYMNFFPDHVVGDAAARAKKVNAMRHQELESRAYLLAELTAGQRARLDEDLDELEDVIRTGDSQVTRSVIVFKAGAELARGYGLRVRTTDRLTVDLDPDVTPLEVVLETHPSALIVEIEKEEARFWIHRLGEWERVRRIQDFVPSDTVRAGRPGVEQRHRLTHLHWHLSDTAVTAEKLVSEQGLEIVVLAGDERVLAEFDDLMSKAMRERVVGRLDPLPPTDRGEWERKVGEVLRAYRRRQEEAALEPLGDYRARGRVRQGLEATLEVANLFLIRRLFLLPGQVREGYVCRQHHFLALDPQDCPFCGARLSPAANVFDELVEYSLMNGVELTQVTTIPERLEPYGGVVAVTYRLSRE